MYKLIAIGGQIRGKEFELQEGESTIGRDETCDIHLPLGGISKTHLKITVNGSHAYVEDLGSSNGTFVNGKLIKRINAKGGDKVALPNVIFQLVYIQERTIAIAKDDTEEKVDDLVYNPTGNKFFVNTVTFFQRKIMPAVYNINKEYEWRILVGIFFSIFVFATVALSIQPVIRTSRNILLYEVVKRGSHYAKVITQINRKTLERKRYDQLDTNFLDKEDGVVSYELFDMEGRVLQPLAKLNQITSEYFSNKAREWYEIENNALKTFKKRLGDGEIGIAKMIRVYNPRREVEEPVGIIAIRFKPTSLAYEASSNVSSYLEAVATSAVIGLLLYAFLYFLTMKPITDMRNQIEAVLAGKEKSLKSDYLMSEILPLRNSINALLQTVRELQGDGSDTEFEEQEDDSTYVAVLEEFMTGADGPVMILDSDKKIKRINVECEDLVGIRESMGVDMDVMEVAKDQGFAATVVDMCDRCANDSGKNQTETYELAGYDYNIHITALMGKDSFAKAYYISFVKDE